MLHFVIFAASWCVHLLGVFTHVTHVSACICTHSCLRNTVSSVCYRGSFDTPSRRHKVIVGPSRDPRKSSIRLSCYVDAVLHSATAEFPITPQPLRMCSFSCSLTVTRIWHDDDNKGSQDFNGNIISCMFVFSLALGAFNMPALISHEDR